MHRAVVISVFVLALSCRVSSKQTTGNSPQRDHQYQEEAFSNEFSENYFDFDDASREGGTENRGHGFHKHYPFAQEYYYERNGANKKKKPSKLVGAASNNDVKKISNSIKCNTYNKNLRKLWRALSKNNSDTPEFKTLHKIANILVEVVELQKSVKGTSNSENDTKEDDNLVNDRSTEHNITKTNETKQNINVKTNSNNTSSEGAVLDRVQDKPKSTYELMFENGLLKPKKDAVMQRFLNKHLEKDNRKKNDKLSNVNLRYGKEHFYQYYPKRDFIKPNKQLHNPQIYLQDTYYPDIDNYDSLNLNGKKTTLRDRKTHKSHKVSNQNKHKKDPLLYDWTLSNDRSSDNEENDKENLVIRTKLNDEDLNNELKTLNIPKLIEVNTIKALDDSEPVLPKDTLREANAGTFEKLDTLEDSSDVLESSSSEDDSNSNENSEQLDDIPAAIGSSKNTTNDKEYQVTYLVRKPQTVVYHPHVIVQQKVNQSVYMKLFKLVNKLSKSGAVQLLRVVKNTDRGPEVIYRVDYLKGIVGINPKRVMQHNMQVLPNLFNAFRRNNPVNKELPLEPTSAPTTEDIIVTATSSVITTTSSESNETTLNENSTNVFDDNVHNLTVVPVPIKVE